MCSSTFGRPYEIIYVDDGSKDGSFGAPKQLAETASRSASSSSSAATSGRPPRWRPGSKRSRATSSSSWTATSRTTRPRSRACSRRWKRATSTSSAAGARTARTPRSAASCPSRIANWLISKVSGVAAPRLRLHAQGVPPRGAGERAAVRRDAPLHPGATPPGPARPSPSFRSTTGRASTARSKYGINRTIKVLLDLLTAEVPEQLLDQADPALRRAGRALLPASGCSRRHAAARTRASSRTCAINRNPVALIAVFLFLAGLLFITQGLMAELVTRTYFESQGKSTYVIRTMLGRGWRRAAERRTPASAAVAHGPLPARSAATTRQPARRGPAIGRRRQRPAAAAGPGAVSTDRAASVGSAPGARARGAGRQPPGCRSPSA